MTRLTHLAPAILVSVTATHGQSKVRDQLPRRLLDAITSVPYSSSQIEWTVSHLDEREYGLVERFVTRTAGDTIWQVNLGDQDGFHRTAYRRYPDKPIPKAQNSGPRHAMVFEGELWRLDDYGHPPEIGTVSSVDDWPRGMPVDLFALGLAPWWEEEKRNLLGLREVFLESLGEAEVTRVRHPGPSGETISAVYGEHVLEWDLDPSKGGRPVRAALYVRGDLAYSSETEWFEVQGRWLPKTTRFYLQGGREPHKVITVDRASFDKPEHTQVITPNDAGVVFGTQLFATGESPVVIWDGTRKLTFDEYQELLYVYGMRPHPYIQEAMAKAHKQTLQEYQAQMDRTTESWREKHYREHGEAPWLSVGMSDSGDAWDIFVADFSARHNLSDHQQALAKSILTEAKKLRDYHERQHRRSRKEAVADQDQAKLARLDEIKERIFERVLMRGLIKLLPRDQRDQAQHSATCQHR